jgi:predicted GH43/DUF377 family glycosyl hydrolase
MRRLIMDKSIIKIIVILSITILVIGCSIFLYPSQEDVDALIAALEDGDDITEVPLLNPPETPNPATGHRTFSTSILLDWEDMPDAAGYHLQVSSNEDFSGALIADDDSLTESEYQVSSGLSAGETYYWRVCTKNSEEVDGEFSTAWDVYISTLDRTFTKYASNPVLDLGTGGSWEDVVVGAPTIMLKDNTYHMWYSGHDNTNYRIGYATSSDGTSWTKYGSNPVLNLGAGGQWDDGHVAGPTILLKDGSYLMWFGGQDGATWRIGYATSSDGTSWTKYGSNPVLNLGAGGQWDDAGIFEPTVIYENNLFHMWYIGYDGAVYRIGYATSSDGTSWTKYGSNPVLNLGAGGQWDDVMVSHPTVIYENNLFHMWYEGRDGTSYRIGYASSSDGKNWEKASNNPILDISSSGNWDDDYISGPSIMYSDTLIQMWFEGLDGSNSRIGYAYLEP